MNDFSDAHTRVTFVRHGETEWNRIKRVQGASDIPLNDVGRAQARATAQALSSEEFTAVFTSPLGRAHETAQIISDRLGLGEPELLAGVIERNYGEGEGLTDQEIESRWPHDSEVPGRESRDAVVARALAALAELSERFPGGRLLVVSHGGVIGSLARHLTNQKIPAPGQAIFNGSVHHFVYENGELNLEKFNLIPSGNALVDGATH